MRYLRLFCATAILICALAFSAYAGDIECDVVPRSSPQPTATATGDILQPIAEAIAVALLSLS